MEATWRRIAAVVVGALTLVGTVGSLAIAGTAAAGGADIDGGTGVEAPADRSAIGAEHGGHPLRSGESHWQGWELHFDGSQVVSDPGSASESERTFGIWNVDEDGRIDSRVRTFTVNASGEAEIETAGLTGRYVIRYRGDPIYVEDGVGYRSSPPDGTAVTVENSAWRIARQTVSASWSDRTVYNGQLTELTLSSNREEYVVAVSADGIAFENLTRLFPAEAYAPDHDARADEDVLRLSGGSEREYTVNVTGLSATAHVFEFDAVDTTGSVETSLSVSAPPNSPRFVSVERGADAGEVLAITARCDGCYLFLGGPGDGTLDIVELRDENGDGRVSVSVNSRYAGLDLSRESVPSSVTGYDAGPDSARKVPTNEFVSPPDRVGKYALGEVRERVGVPTNGRRTPLSAGIYDVGLSTSKYVSFRSGSEGSGFTIEGETHVQSVTLSEPSLSGVRTSVAPGDLPSDLSLEALRNRTTRSDRVALGDWFVVRVGVSGVSGHLLAEHANGIGGVVDNEDEGIDLTIERVGTSFSSPNRIDLAKSGAELIVDPERNHLYVAIDANRMESNRPVEGGQTYEARFVLDGDAYPYLPSGTTRTASTEITFVEPDANVSTSVEDERVTFSGTTTVAPGSILTVSASVKGEYSWERATGIVVGSDRTWEGSIDFADAPGSEYEVNVSYRGEVLARVDPLVVEPRTATPSASTSPSGPPRTATPGTPSRPPTATATTPAASNGTAAGPTDGGPTPTPGGEDPAGSGSSNDGSSGEGGMPFAPGIPVVGGVLSLVVPAVVVVVLIAVTTLGVMG